MRDQGGEIKENIKRKRKVIEKEGVKIIQLKGRVGGQTVTEVGR